MTLNETDAEDVAAASAAHAYNSISEIANLPPPEGFQRLYDLFYTALQAYADCQIGWGVLPEPSKN
jgi:hypothetical protein